MIEILLIIFQCQKAKGLLSERGYQNRSIYFSIVFTWFTITFVGSGVIALVYYMVSNSDKDPSWLLCYLPTIPLGYLSSHLILKRIESFPKLEGDAVPKFRTPVWHYVVCSLMMLLGFYAILAFLVLIGSELEDLNQKQRDYVTSMTLLTVVGTAGASVLSGFSGFLLLFRLRIGFILFCLSFVTRMAYEFYTEGALFFLPDPVNLGRVIGTIIAYAVPIALIVIWSKWWTKNLI